MAARPSPSTASAPQHGLDERCVSEALGNGDGLTVEVDTALGSEEDERVDEEEPP
ncbi:hypothetical protein [Polyangium spumosum]|uniref:Uncharacterized protein n=1 Tax=Polyangium spumosum TaxID=889282 RepID=A0A6N7Q310_9BACT|nr:hypothetical protein [Polyangium spumosum]MRG96674.1 hypothetical protein [Polyangium spumosum]